MMFVFFLLVLLVVTEAQSVKVDTDALYDCLLYYGTGDYNMPYGCRAQMNAAARRMKRNLNLDQNEVEFLWGLEAELQRELKEKRTPDMYSYGGAYGNDLTIRQECRAMSERQRTDLFDAINYIKKNTSNPNVYLTLAKLHVGDLVFRHAHGGSNFMSWHRIYLLYLERALQRVNRNVALCYLDSTIDFRLGTKDWVRSVAFTDILFGSATGVVTDGPFTNWVLPSPPALDDSTILQRDMRIGKAQPFDPRASNLILNSPKLLSHSSITVGGSGFLTITNHQSVTRNVTLEGEHNNVHVWIGGAMGGGNTAPLEPVFFFHHCYVDYVWEGFRKKMRRYGRDPTTDYPEHGDSTTQKADYPMIGFPWYKNIDGYSDTFIRDIYTYEATPTCRGWRANCKHSRFMECNGKNECVAKSETWEAFDQITAAKTTPPKRLVKTGHKFVATSNSA